MILAFSTGLLLFIASVPFQMSAHSDMDKFLEVEMRVYSEGVAVIDESRFEIPFLKESELSWITMDPKNTEDGSEDNFLFTPTPKLLFVGTAKDLGEYGVLDGFLCIDPDNYPAGSSNSVGKQCERPFKFKVFQKYDVWWTGIVDKIQVSIKLLKIESREKKVIPNIQMKMKRPEKVKRKFKVRKSNSN